MTGAQEQTAVFTVLFVCTGNICRSALAERLGRAYLDEVLGERATFLRIASAGIGAVVGSGMHPDSALVLAGFGADPAGFRARQLDGAAIASADLVLTMTREHRRAVLQLAPKALNKTFTLREAADVATQLEGETVGATCVDRGRDLVRQLANGRSRRTHGDDDVPDPINRPPEVHQRAGDLIVEALIPLLDRIAALCDAADAGPRPEG